MTGVESEALRADRDGWKREAERQATEILSLREQLRITQEILLAEIRALAQENVAR
jgi:hypothetical protein